MSETAQATAYRNPMLELRVVSALRKRVRPVTRKELAIVLEADGTRAAHNDDLLRVLVGLAESAVIVCGSTWDGDFRVTTYRLATEGGQR
jgi:hypothetical protein